MTDYITKSFEEIKKDLGGYIVATLIYVAIVGGISFFVSLVLGFMGTIVSTLLMKVSEHLATLAGYIPSIIDNFITWAVTGPFTIGYYLVLRKRLLTGEMDFGGLFKGFQPPLLLPSIIVGVVSNLLTGFGTCCFIIPGILLWILLMFSYFIVLDGEVNGINAMIKSKDMVLKNFGGFLVLGLLCGALNFVGVLCCCIGVLVTLPVSSVAMILCYENEKTSKDLISLVSNLEIAPIEPPPAPPEF